MTQTFITIPMEEWKRVVDILQKVEERLKPDEKWICTEEACKILGITKATWLRYRKKFKIACSQVGRNVMVRKSDVEQLLNKRTL